MCISSPTCNQDPACIVSRQAIVLLVVEFIKMSQIEISSYSAAGGISSEAFASIRTVVSFGMQGRTAEAYDVRIRNAERGILASAKKVGLAYATFLSSMFYVLSVGLLYVCLRASKERELTSWVMPLGCVASPCDVYDLPQLIPGNTSNCTYPFRMSCSSAEFLLQASRSGGSSLLLPLGLSSAAQLSDYLNTNGHASSCFYRPGPTLTALFATLFGLVAISVAPMRSEPERKPIRTHRTNSSLHALADLGWN